MVLFLVVKMTNFEIIFQILNSFHFIPWIFEIQILFLFQENQP